ncbi:MAG: hypothetical protein GF344_02545 [Chitinivibrionales bacterium]|nr:hypothetical protein [Chitinivibrionales bacterium]MBD3355966.1 hypothetical protein [Chitinivibrionales bacterium]
MSIRWIRNVLLDGEKATLEIQLGDFHIGDKCYTRINNEMEQYFDNLNESRDDIVAQGLDILKRRLEGRNVTYPDGRNYDWT